MTEAQTRLAASINALSETIDGAVTELASLKADEAELGALADQVDALKAKLAS